MGLPHFGNHLWSKMYGIPEKLNRAHDSTWGVQNTLKISLSKRTQSWGCFIPQPHHTVLQEGRWRSNLLPVIAFLFQLFSIMATFQISFVCFPLLSNFIQPSLMSPSLFFISLYLGFITHICMCYIQWIEPLYHCQHQLLQTTSHKLKKIKATQMEWKWYKWTATFTKNRGLREIKLCCNSMKATKEVWTTYQWYQSSQSSQPIIGLPSSGFSQPGQIQILFPHSSLIWVKEAGRGWWLGWSKEVLGVADYFLITHQSYLMVHTLLV